MKISISKSDLYLMIKSYRIFLKILIIVIGFQSIVYAEGEIHSKHFVFGMPKSSPSTNDIIIRDIYALSSNDKTKFADWVCYYLDKNILNGNVSTNRRLEAEPFLDESETLELDDYKGAHKALGLDKGHLAPLGSFKGSTWQDTNYLSNIIPQKSNLNQGAWASLENRIRCFVNDGKAVYVITGPLYEKTMPVLPNADEPHTIPSGFFKIIVQTLKGSAPKVAGYIFPQDAPKNASIDDFAASVDEIEKRSGLDVLWELPDDIENKIEQTIDNNWLQCTGSNRQM